MKFEQNKNNGARRSRQVKHLKNLQNLIYGTSFFIEEVAIIQGYNCRVYEKAYEALLLMKNMEA